MQYHHHGYVDHDPRVRDAAGTGIDRPDDLPDVMDVLIVGAGPSGIVQAAQLTDYPSITTRIIERRPERLKVGRADGLWSRSQETFQAFGFQERIYAEGQPLRDVCFWGPDPADRSKIARGVRVQNQTGAVSEYPLLIVNQSRVIDYFAEYAANGPARITIDYGYTLVDLEVEDGEYPVRVVVETTDGEQRTVRAKYVIGCEGSRSKVRDSVGITVNRDPSAHAWAVMDVLGTTDFPDARRHCGIQSQEHGSILQIPREGGFLTRYYVSLGDIDDSNRAQIFATTTDEAIEKANRILHPYTLDVKKITWNSVYEVRHTVAQTFDDVAATGDPNLEPRVFVCGDACHTHSAKAGQGMNVSIQDGWNIAWKLGQVLEGRSTPALLRTYNDERQEVAQNLIDFDKQYSAILSKQPEPTDDPADIGAFYEETVEFPAGFLTEYKESIIVGSKQYQELATGFPIGRRFRSAPVSRIADAQTINVGHHFRADGRWRVYVFADKDGSEMTELARWLETSDDSPVRTFTPAGTDVDSVFDVKVIYQQPYTDIEVGDVPTFFRPKVGPYELVDYEKAYAVLPEDDFFEARGISRDGAIVIVRPDMYVGHVLPLTARDELAEFFGRSMLPQN